MHSLHKITRLQTRGSNHTHTQCWSGSLKWAAQCLVWADWAHSLQTHTILRLCRPGRKTDRGANRWVETREWRTVTTTLRFIINIQPTDQNESPRVHWLGAGGVTDRECHTVMWPRGHWEQWMDHNTLSQQPWYGPDQPRRVPLKHKIGLLSRKAHSSFSEKRCHIQS